MWHRQKKKRRTNPDQDICGVEVSQGPPEASVLVASSSVSKACCHCSHVNRPRGTLQGQRKLFACCANESDVICSLKDKLEWVAEAPHSLFYSQ